MRVRQRPTDHKYDLAQLFEPIGSRQQMVTNVVDDRLRLARRGSETQK